MKTFLIATRNKHKVEEIRAILGSGFTVKTLDDFPGASDVIEDAPTFAGNAMKKAVELARWISLKSQPSSINYVLADDSGLEVDALNGAPGVHSARFAADDKTKGNSSDAANRLKLLSVLTDVPAERRTARFRCVIALTPMILREAGSASPVCYADEMELQTELFDGACEGKIILQERGQKGFGYDSLFVPEGFSQTFAELGDETKNQISHRAKALASLRQRLSI